ncbi:MAG TPA: trigger factor [Planctomycetaceae bacterium]|nr:trigger factor [Planctomycetaceae bacterium]
MTTAQDRRTEDETGAAEALVTEDAEPAGDGDGGETYQLHLDVSVEQSGPCRKHVRVTVPREDLDHFYSDAVGELLSSAEVPGFRKGHVPQALVEKRFRKELSDQVKQKVLLQSLEEVSESEELDPINEPDIDVESLEIPEEGDFTYEFEVEVRPEFDLPDYTGLVIKRPTRTISEADVDVYLARFLKQYEEPVPHEGPAERGDHVNASVEFRHEGRPLRRIADLTVELKPVLQFSDAQIEGFDALMDGVRAGETREADLTVSSEAELLAMRGETVHATFQVKGVRRVRRPELTREFLERIGVETEEGLRDVVRKILERQVLFQQRQAVREQVLNQITASADWDLPEELVLRQVENAIRREILEMQQAGFTTPQIQARENEIRQRAVTTTRQALKEHFVLDKIATEKGLSVGEPEIAAEIQLMAMQRGESPRRVRARLQKSGMIENLEAQIRERMAVDVVLSQARFEDVPMDLPIDDRIEAVPQSICGAASEPVTVPVGADED